MSLRPCALVAVLASVLFPLPALAADLDLVFVLDTTGSMAGEIREAKERVTEIAATLREARSGERVRLGVVAYRDRGDEYVTLVSPLSTSIDDSFTFLAGLSANGGGDGPEDLLSGLGAALDEMAWDPRPDVERQVFVIADAPAHFDYNDGATFEQIVARARERRIVLNTIGCRSLPAEGVEQLRRFAYATEGSYQHIGRVSAGDPGLAEAMLDALTPTATDDPSDGERTPVAVRPIGNDADAPSPGGVLVIYDRDGCALRVAAPRGLAVELPRAELGRDALEVEVRLTQGAGGTSTYALAPCVATHTPITISFGG